MLRNSSESSSRTSTAACPAAGASIPPRRPSTRGSQGFRVTAAGPTPPTPPTPPSSRVCPSSFTVLHNDHIGSFAIRKGRYRITLLSVGRISCAQASNNFAQFLQDFDGILPRPWFVAPSTGTFMRGSRYVGFPHQALERPAAAGRRRWQAPEHGWQVPWHLPRGP